jgi:hypothetical protein
MVVDGMENFAQELSAMHDRYLIRKELSFVSWVSSKLLINKPEL